MYNIVHYFEGGTWEQSPYDVDVVICDPIKDLKKSKIWFNCEKSVQFSQYCTVDVISTR